MSLNEILATPDKIAASRNPEIYLNEIWQRYYSDVQRVNEIEIAYCQPWKRRLGLIRLSLDNTRSFIGINALLQLPEVPEHILIITIAHELAHYTHGFGSPLPRLYEHPHANNVVNHELERRGLGETMHLCEQWIDNQWFAFYDQVSETGQIKKPPIRSATRAPRKSHP
jgi:hypothetical protein